MKYDDRWLPYLGDAVDVRVGNQPVTGFVTRYDATVVETPGVLGVRVGDRVQCTWHVGGQEHTSQATVEELTFSGFTLRLPRAPVSHDTRRAHERVDLSLRVLVVPAHHGSLGYQPHAGRTLNLSNGGARALIDSAEPLPLGETLEVRLELGDRIETLTAHVVWEQGHSAGERIAGLRFDREIEASSWAAMARAGT